MLYPLVFVPIYKERIWGGRKIETLFGKPLPPGVPIGESWEITDRPGGDVSEIANGPLRGRKLDWLVQQHGRDLLGDASTSKGRFPLLVKILDAREKLSLQVHPPPAVAPRFGGEPKTEMWYVVAAAPGAELFVGLKRGVTEEEFRRKLAERSLPECFHRISVHPGDAMFLPSGRVHAIGAGLVIFEIQQNSDTTFRVHDWDRLDAGGKPRQLHIAESLASIDFNDIQPEPIRPAEGGAASQVLVSGPLFEVRRERLTPGAETRKGIGRPQIVAVVTGQLTVEASGVPVQLRAGEFGLLPASLSQFKLECVRPAEVLLAAPG